MREEKIITPVTYATLSELSNPERELAEMAIEATSRAYAPYSHFHVGAAIRLEGGEIVTGANQENAAFPSGTCAERTACYYAHAAHPGKKFEAIAIAARNSSGELTPTPTAPCGACRQALLEYETLAGRPVRVLLVAANEVAILPSVASTLPLAFTKF
ncbi:MAG: cytidine deaminase [Pseudoflavonifractor sp.]|nr:cytidine deaminase [Alloprevotella sp.]MCM1116533.1 cytidine deaminase [Pseudoflavonifractor sp.]